MWAPQWTTVNEEKNAGLDGLSPLTVELQGAFDMRAVTTHA